MGKYLQMLREHKQVSKKSICPNTIPTKLTEGNNDSFVSNVSDHLADIEISNNNQPWLSNDTLNTINAWFKLINETSQSSKDHVIDACRRNPETLDYILDEMAKQQPNSTKVPKEKY